MFDKRIVMGNLFSKKTDNGTELSISKTSTFRYPGTSVTHHSILSLDEYIKNELSAVISNSSYVTTCFNSDNISDQKEETKGSIVLTDEQLEDIYMEYKAINRKTPILGIHMGSEMVNTVRHLFESLLTDMICKADHYQAYMETDVDLIEKYSKTEMDRKEYNAEQMFLRHFIKMIVTYEMILDHLERNRAEVLLQQLATSHCLLDIRGDDYKAMNLHLVKYLLQRNLIDNETIISIVGFLNLVSDEMKKILRENRNKVGSSNFSRIELDVKSTIAKDDYRCMKNWSHVVSIIDMKTNIIQKQIRIQNEEDELEDEAYKRRLKKRYEGTKKQTEMA